MHPEPCLEIHPKDAENLGITNGVMVNVQSRRGVARFKALVTKAIAPGTVFAPMHWGFLWADLAEANVLTHPECCPDSLQPELKACAVMVTPVQWDMEGNKAIAHSEPNDARSDATQDSPLERDHTIKAGV